MARTKPDTYQACMRDEFWRAQYTAWARANLYAGEIGFIATLNALEKAESDLKRAWITFFVNRRIVRLRDELAGFLRIIRLDAETRQRLETDPGMAGYQSVKNIFQRQLEVNYPNFYHSKFAIDASMQ